MTNRTTPVGTVDEELVERLRETSHDPACPFNLNCYCDDQGSHDRISDPDKQQAATLIEQLREERDALLQRPLDLAKMDSADDDVPEKMLAYYWCEQAREAREKVEQLHNRVERLPAIADRIERQAECLEGYAEKAGHEARPIPSVFHSQATHFRDLAAEIRALTGEHNG